AIACARAAGTWPTDSRIEPFEPSAPFEPFAPLEPFEPLEPLECRVPLLATAVGLSILGSCGGVVVASSLLLFSDAARRRVVPWLVSYAVGALLGVALLALLPEALTL